jgi:peptidoglycan/xylan/chitin deacetylase (PgdA/CDA1 family)
VLTVLGASAVKALTIPAGTVDRWLARGRRMLFGETPGIVVPVFHAVLPAGLRAPDVDPGYAVTLEQLAEVLDYFRRQRFTPISVAQLEGPLDPRRNFVMFTFDDGYANNLAALDMFESAGAPVLMSINTGNTRSGESFWWDVLYRELSAAGTPTEQIYHERSRLIEMTPAEIRTELVARFGPHAFRARGDQDRPLSVAELQALARRPLITLGNHTIDHALLDGGDREAVSRSLRRSQQDCLELSGSTPTAIAYPFGRYDDVTIACCDALAIKVGLTGEFGKASFADVGERSRMLRVPRCVICGDRPIAPQCENMHMDWKPSWMVRRWFRRARSGRSVPGGAM